MSAAPWEVDAALKPARLLQLARLAVETRSQAYAEANHALGDTSWGIGCKAHERYAHAVERLAETERGWLAVHRDGLAFTTVVEGVAIRAYRGPSDKPHARHLYAAHLETAQLELARAHGRQLALPFFGAHGASGEGPSSGEGSGERGVDGADRGARPSPWAWLMAVETDDEGRPLRVVFFQANDLGERRNAWVAPVPIPGAHVQAALFSAASSPAPSSPLSSRAPSRVPPRAPPRAQSPHVVRRGKASAPRAARDAHPANAITSTTTKS